MPHKSLSQIDAPLLERADILVQSANINGISMFTPLLDQFSFLRETDPENWDFILTVAGVQEENSCRARFNAFAWKAGSSSI